MPCTSGKGFGFIIIGKSLIIIVVVGSLRLGGPGVYKISQSLRFLRNGTEYWGLFPFVHNGPAFMRFLVGHAASVGMALIIGFWILHHILNSIITRDFSSLLEPTGLLLLARNEGEARA